MNPMMPQQPGQGAPQMGGGQQIDPQLLAMLLMQRNGMPGGAPGAAMGQMQQQPMAPPSGVGLMPMGGQRY